MESVGKSRQEGFQFDPEGKDRRVEISAQLMKTHPYRSIVLIYSIIKGNIAKVGTGFLLNNQHVLTAAHNLTPEGAQSHHQISKNIIVYLAPYGPRHNNMGDLWKNKRTVFNHRIKPEYWKNKLPKSMNAQNDLAILKLDSPFDQEGLIDFQPPRDVMEFREQECEIVGYPGDMISNNYAILKSYTNKILKMENGVAGYQIHTSQGVSGAPIFFKGSNGKIVPIGHHSYYSESNSCNFGIIYTPKNIQFIKDMIKEMIQPIRLTTLRNGECITTTTVPQMYENPELSTNQTTEDTCASSEKLVLTWSESLEKCIQNKQGIITNVSSNAEDYVMVASNEVIPMSRNSIIKAARISESLRSIIFALITKEEKDRYSKRYIKTDELLSKQTMNLGFLAFEQTRMNVMIKGTIYDNGTPVQKTTRLLLRIKAVFCFKINAGNNIIELMGEFKKDDVLNTEHQKIITGQMQPLYLGVFLKSHDSIQLLQS